MILLNKTTCPNCERTVPKKAKFCPDCGASLIGGSRICGTCGTENRSDARFCKNCGREFGESAAPEMRRNHWARREEDFAVRVEADDLPGILKHGLIVDPGVNALLVEKGAVVGTVTHGEYSIDTLGERIREWFAGRIPERITALLVEITPTELVFELDDLFSKDPILIRAKVRLQAEVKEPGKFLVNILKGRERLTKEYLRQYLQPEVFDVAKRWVKKYFVEDLAENLSLSEKFELALDEALRTTFRQMGLSFLNVRVLELDLAHIDRLNNIHSNYTLQISEAEAQAQGKKSWVDAKRELDLAKLAEETLKVEMEEERVALYQRMREAVMSDRMNEVYSKAEFEEFLDDIDRDKLIREKDRKEMLRDWGEEAEDHDRARAHLLAKLEIEHKYELRAIELKQRADLGEKALEAKLRLARMRATKEEEIKFAKWEFKIRRDRAEAEFRREQAKADLQQEELTRSTHLALEQDEFDEEMRQMGAELELGLKGLRGIKQVRAEAEQAKWDLEQQKLAFEWEKKQQQLDMELQRERIKMEHELNRLDKLGELGAEALIAASGAEQARLLADLKRAESLKEMSEEQILAAAAKDSPEVARAFQEKFRAIAEGKASQREREMYEKLLAEKESRERATVEAWDKASARAKETTERALDRMADTAQAFAKGQGGTPIVITSSDTPAISSNQQSGSQRKDAGSEYILCPECRRKIDPDENYCPHCGKSMLPE